MGFINQIKSIRYQFQKKQRSRKLQLKFDDFLRKNSAISDELRSALNFYKTNDIQTFPYSFPEKYRNNSYEILSDNFSNYALVNGQKMYFRKDWSQNSCLAYLRTLMIEQDAASPHAYFSESFILKSDEILIDVGSAEGYFSYLNLHLSKKIYAFEMNQKWIEVLENGFQYCNAKIVLYPNKLGNSNKNGNYRLDDFQELYKEKLFIKIDAEGSEHEVFEGMKKLLTENPNVKVAVCTYHQNEDAKTFEKLFKSLGYQTTFSDGYMLYQFAKDLEPPYLRKGVLRAWKEA